MNEVVKNVNDLNKTKKELINKLKQVESEHERFVSMNNELNNFVHAISHDLKSPINHLKGLISLLSAGTPKSADEHKFYELIHVALHNLTNRIEDLSTLGSAQEYEDFNSQRFASIMEDVSFDLQEQIKESNAKIIQDFSEASTINFSKKNLRCILYNLISNAIKYKSPDRPPIVNIFTEKLGTRGILLRVVDNGIGIKDEDKFKVFLMYKRLVNHVEGKGVGLALVKRIIDNAGGRIEVESEPQQGSCFKIFLRN